MINEMSAKRKGVYIFLISFLVLYILSVLINLNYPLLSGEEPRRALVSIEMLHSGNYIMPSIFGEDYFNKPPIFNWILTGFFYITGSESEWVVRLPSLLFLLIFAGTHYFIAKKFLPKTIAALSSLFTLTSADIYFYALQNGGEIDIFYALVVYLQAISLFYFGHYRRWLYFFLASYLFCAIGFLTKGFPSLVFQVFTLLAVCVYHRSIKYLFRWQHLAGISIFLIVTGVYLYFFSFYNPPQRLLINLLNESFKKSAVGERSEKLWSKAFTYPALILKFLLPWSLLLLLLVKKIRLHIWSNPLVRFSILFIIFNIGVYWFTGRPKLRYVYMFLPFFYTILAYLYWKYKSHYFSTISKFLKYTGFLFLLILGGVVVLPFFLNVSIFWVVLMAVALLIFSYNYFRQSRFSIWFFIIGVVLTRLVYAALIVPVEHERSSMRYDLFIKEIGMANNHQPVTYWSPADSLDFVIDVKINKWEYESLASPPEFHYQLPYYYHRATGDIMQYASSIQPNQTYLTFKGWLKDSSVTVLWTSHDLKVGDALILFKK
ncbi:glycosyltransferase family 39 protein [Chitinophagaceae bacterium LB-8]|uniref:Glycosyltransferase family 39 protein n=1 Tax=Paraflavisolibacter caeni TaxID=2982496 RepID=A0A9X2XWM2_9BACT|nr:glycosyltransferase family 39 protein [Paraflavisolibacter caeni]MCU7550017.1 glycosyltransferase family 39 protein [Paraflavisolibacter caeni]